MFRENSNFIQSLMLIIRNRDNVLTVWRAKFWNSGERDNRGEAYPRVWKVSAVRGAKPNTISCIWHHSEWGPKCQCKPRVEGLLLGVPYVEATKPNEMWLKDSY